MTSVSPVRASQHRTMLPWICAGTARPCMRLRAVQFRPMNESETMVTDAFAVTLSRNLPRNSDWDKSGILGCSFNNVKS